MICLACLARSSQAQYTNHGPQVFAKAVQGSQFIKDKQGQEYLFTVVRGNPARLLGYNLSTGNKIFESALTGTDGSWDMTLSSDNILYATGNGKLYSYQLGDQAVKDLGHAMPHQKVIWDLHPAENGKIYGGTYPDAMIFSYHPQSGFEEVSKATTFPGENYVRSLVYNSKNKQIYAGTGSNAKFIQLDPKTKASKSLVDDNSLFKEFVYDMDIQYNIHNDDMIIAFINNNSGSQTIIYSIKKARIIAVLPPLDIKSIARDPKSTCIYYTAQSKVYQLDLGKSTLVPELLTAISGSGKTGVWTDKDEYQVFTTSKHVYNINPLTKALQQQELAVPNSPINIQTIFWGPDNKVWSAGYLAGQHGTYDPKTGQHQEYAGLHQTEGMNNLGDKLYFGIYTKAHIYAYDVTKPWNLSAENPKHIGQIKDQDRPFAVITLPARKEVLFGTVPPYGALGGVISQLQTTNNTLETFTDVIPNQSIVSLLNYKDRVIGGSSIAGGLGIKPTEKRGTIFEWDPVAKQVLWKDSIADYWSISGLFQGPDNLIWGFADGSLFAYDIQGRKVVYELPVYKYASYPSHIWRNGLGIYHPNGLIYFTLNDSLYSFDFKKEKLLKLRDEASLMILGKDQKIYFRQGTDLWSYTP